MSVCPGSQEKGWNTIACSYSEEAMNDEDSLYLGGNPDFVRPASYTHPKIQPTNSKGRESYQGLQLLLVASSRRNFDLKRSQHAAS